MEGRIMETSILVTTLNNHRNNEQAKFLIVKALNKLGYEVDTNFDNTKDYKLSIVWNSQQEYFTLLDEIKHRSKTVLYMYVDNDLPIPNGVEVISQFSNTSEYWFPISELAVFHHFWNNPIVSPKKFKYFYGGTFKPRRDYSVLPNTEELLLCGDDTRWDMVSKATRFPTIRDMNILYSLMALCETTYIVPDPTHNKINTPTRLFEGVFTNCYVVDMDGKIYSPEDIKSIYNEEYVLDELKNLMEEYYGTYYN
jgi:hypothetical protein